MSPRYKLGEYRLIRRVGVGGMAEVYQAERGGTQGFSKQLALKVLLPHFQRDQEVVRSFIDEATIAASLAHPNVVPIYDFGQIDGTYFLAMEFQDGWDLREVLRRCAEQRRPLPVPAVAYIGHELAMALDHIHRHERQIVHRDVSPHNVFADRAGQIKLGDFGVAQAVARLAQTEQGQIKGKLAYLAPEQASGDPITARADVYAAGLLIFEMLTGARYNQAEREADLLAVAMSPVARAPSSLRAEAQPLDRIVGDALQRHPTMRTRDAGLLAEQLDSYLARAPYGASELAAFLAELDQARPPSAEQAGIPIGPLGVGRRATATEPPMASGTVRLPAELLVNADDDPAQQQPRSASRLTVGLVLLVALAAGASGAVWLAGSGTAPAPDAAGAAGDAAAAEAADAALPLLRDATEPRPADASATSNSADAAGAPPDLRTGRPPRLKRRRPQRRPPRRRLDAGATRKPVPRPPKVADGEARASQLRALAEIVAAARRRGLHPGDDAGYDSRRATARRSIQAGKSEGAAALSKLRAYAERFAVNQRFIKRKLSRLERAIARAPVNERQRLQAASQRILRLVLGDRLAAASAQISRLLGQLR